MSSSELKFSPIQDIISGIIMAGTSVPQLLAYAETVGYAGYRGLVSAGPSLFAWGVATGSPFMNCGVTSLSALMTKADLRGEEYILEHGEENYVKLVSAYSIYVGFASFGLALVGFGKIAKRVPKTVRSGFKWGCAIGVFNSAIPNAILAHGKSSLKKTVIESEFMSTHILHLQSKFPTATGLVSTCKILFILFNPTLWTLRPVLLFLFCFIVVMYGKSFLPKMFPPGTEVIIATFTATVYSVLSEYSSATVGEIPQFEENSGISLLGGALNLPIEIHSFQNLLEVPLKSRFSDSSVALILSACIFARVNFLSVVGIASTFEAEDNIPWSPSRELSAQGVACVVAGLTGSAPVSASLSRSLVSRMSGTTSKFCCIVTAVCWMCLLPYMSIMTPTPKAALSAIIISAVIKVVAYPKDLLHLTTWGDRFVGWGTGIVTVVTSPTLGFLAGVIFALVLHLCDSLFGNKQYKSKKID